MTNEFAERINRELGNRGFWDAAYTYGIANLMLPTSQEKRDKAADELQRIVSEAALAALPPSSGWEAGAEALRQVDDLSILVRSLVHSLKKHKPDSDLAERAAGYLRSKGLQGSPLRSEPLPPPPSREGTTPWQPFATAPKDGSLIDIWWNGWRHPDCQWVPNLDCWQQRYAEGDYWMEMFIADDDMPSHWMAKPTPPGKDA